MIIITLKQEQEYNVDLAKGLIDKLSKERAKLCHQWDADGQRTGTELGRRLDENRLLLLMLKNFVAGNR